ncbi:MAG TPA: peptide-methionine (S)-S-oxide reductase MsrA [Candidatus Andersenbacteria bacterium]|nr:peptide-methionine (S)-S-oxide reductase MsrA [Candidatus Andersenbacteria bacterium]
MNTTSQTAIFGGGCFWCTEAIFSSLKGVREVMPGYAGGTVPNPSYEQVCSGKTGHAEATKIVFDPSVITYNDLLTVFFATHDPTILNRQGADVGTQYRSAIFFTSPEQETEAKNFIEKLNQDGKKVVTEITPFTEFYPAEDYHKNYYENHKDQPYCEAVISPKLEKLQAKFSELLKK